MGEGERRLLMRRERDEEGKDREMEGWDLAISVEYLTFIQMITPSLGVLNSCSTETDSGVQKKRD